MYKINAGGVVVKWGLKVQGLMGNRCSKSVPARLHHREGSWHMADWETEIGLSRALWLWRESAARYKQRRAKRNLKGRVRKVMAALLIEQEFGLTTPAGWMEFLQRLQDEQRAALSRRLVIWIGVTARCISLCRQLAAMCIKNDASLTLPHGWREFLRRVLDDQLAALKSFWVVWSGIVARYIRVKTQLATATHSSLLRQR